MTTANLPSHKCLSKDFSEYFAIPSTSSSDFSSPSGDDSHDELHSNKQSVNKGKSFRRITKCMETVGSRMYITDEIGKNKRQCISTSYLLKPVVVERIDLDQRIFGTETDHLMPLDTSDYESEDYDSDSCEDTQKMAEMKRHYATVYERVGLPVHLEGDSATIKEEARIDPATRCAMFGCETLPLPLLEKTFKEWMKTPTDLCRLVISTRDRKNRAKMEKLRSTLPLVKVWSLSGHATSVYRMQDISTCQEKYLKEDFEIYVLICDDGRIAAMGVSDYALSVFIGGCVPNSFVFPVMKSAFTEITKSNNFYEIKERQLLEEWETVKENFRKGQCVIQ